MKREYVKKTCDLIHILLFTLNHVGKLLCDVFSVFFPKVWRKCLDLVVRSWLVFSLFLKNVLLKHELSGQWSTQNVPYFIIILYTWEKLLEIFYHHVFNEAYSYVYIVIHPSHFLKFIEIHRIKTCASRLNILRKTQLL